MRSCVIVSVTKLRKLARGVTHTWGSTRLNLWTSLCISSFYNPRTSLLAELWGKCIHTEEVKQPQAIQTSAGLTYTRGTGGKRRDAICKRQSHLEAGRKLRDEKMRHTLEEVKLREKAGYMLRDPSPDGGVKLLRAVLPPAPTSTPPSLCYDRITWTSDAEDSFKGAALIKEVLAEWRGCQGAFTLQEQVRTIWSNSALRLTSSTQRLLLRAAVARRVWERWRNER